jgi:hypothetical protein
MSSNAGKTDRQLEPRTRPEMMVGELFVADGKI